MLLPAPPPPGPTDPGAAARDASANSVDGAPRQSGAALNALQPQRCLNARVVATGLIIQWYMAILAALAAEAACSPEHAAYFACSPEAAAGTALMLTEIVIAVWRHALAVDSCCRFCRVGRAATLPDPTYATRVKIWFEAAIASICAYFCEAAANTVRMTVGSDPGDRSPAAGVVQLPVYAVCAAAVALALATCCKWKLNASLPSR